MHIILIINLTVKEQNQLSTNGCFSLPFVRNPFHFYLYYIIYHYDQTMIYEVILSIVEIIQAFKSEFKSDFMVYVYFLKEKCSNNAMLCYNI